MTAASGGERPLSASVPLAAKVAFLSRPDAYPERPRRVEAVETHMSWVFLTDRHAYKLKKPVRYPFLDFGTLEARRRDCEDEVRLNRRLAPDVYLGTLPLTADAAGRLRLGNGGAGGRATITVDWLVRMRRLPADRTLDHMLRNGTADPDLLRALFLKLARFYAAAPPVALAPADYRCRFEDDIRASLRELTRPEFGLPGDAPRRVAAAQLGFLARRGGELLAARAGAGRIVEAHGDLRPEHVYLLDPEPVVVDCLEFNRAFRLLDPADELAYLAVECDRLGAPAAGRLGFETYREITGDAPPPPLVAFYRSNRACLRAKIALWHLDEPPVRTPERWRGAARDYLRLAERYVAALI